ncbi:zinc-binding domain-containing protein [Aspergillus desertorum]
MRSRNRGNGKPYSMYPALHPSVVEHLKPCGLATTFHPIDSDEYPQKPHIRTCTIAIRGVFPCYNKSCPSPGWASRMVAATIRMYRKAGKDNRSGKIEGEETQPGLYNVRVYHQRCKRCNFLSRPKLDESYAERVADRLKKWHGIEVEVEEHAYVRKRKAPHAKRLCEGCKAGVCQFSRGSGGDWDP